MRMSRTHHDGQDVLGAGLAVQRLTSGDGPQTGVNTEEVQAAGVDGALQRELQTVVPIQVRSHNLEDLRVWLQIFRNSDFVGGLGEDRRIVVVVHHRDINLEHEEGQQET